MVQLKMRTAITLRPTYLGVTSPQGTRSQFDAEPNQSITAAWVRQTQNGEVEFQIVTPQGPYLTYAAPADSIQVVSAFATDELSSQVRAFLNLISVPEGTSGPDGYRICFTGSLCVPSDFHDHPRKVFCANGLCSDAAGRYQFLSTTWDDVQMKLGLPDFSPASQDAGAVERIRFRQALDAVEAGDIVAACTGSGANTGVAYEWASLPPGRYGQPSITFDQAKELFVKYGGRLST